MNSWLKRNSRKDDLSKVGGIFDYKVFNYAKVFDLHIEPTSAHHLQFIQFSFIDPVSILCLSNKKYLGLKRKPSIIPQIFKPSGRTVL